MSGGGAVGRGSSRAFSLFGRKGGGACISCVKSGVALRRGLKTTPSNEEEK